MRTATVAPPAVTAEGTTVALGTTSVSGPGQNASASFMPAGGRLSATSNRSAGSANKIGMALSRLRSLAV